MSLRNRVALVTGGSRGIGRGLALRLAQDGARIAIAYRSNKVAAQQTLRQLQANGADCVAVETDITDAGRCDQLTKTVVDRFGRVDIIVNNVGDFRWGTLAESSLQDWQSIFTSNLLTVLRSEEHTSELQSQSNLVCRLLLEKKKNIPATQIAH